jgi:tripartite-type tricarboxylate transporter receptor subunit TctC
MKELGYDMEYSLWVGIFAPKGTPAPVIAKLSKSIDQAATSAEYRSAIENLGQELAYLNAADFAKFWAADAKHADEAVHLIGRVQG